MERYYLVALVTLLSGLVLFGMGFTVAGVHRKTKIFPPAMTGDPLLERAVRAHSNTLEWYPIFLPSMWLFAIYGNVTWAATLGVLWLIGRVVYFAGYLKAANKRFPDIFSASRPTSF